MLIMEALRNAIGRLRNWTVVSVIAAVWIPILVAKDRTTGSGYREMFLSVGPFLTVDVLRISMPRSQAHRKSSDG